MRSFKRNMEIQIRATLDRGKSILLLGVRKTGKTTVIQEQCSWDLYYSFLDPDIRLRFSSEPGLLIKEIKAFKETFTEKRLPVVVIDEVQKYRK